MIIKEIELNNFRIYKGVNKINLLPHDDKNVIIISGNNGFGKTTFLMSLVWCLYGRQMGNVDELYSREIEEKGGYKKYIGNSLNFEAQRNGETRFSVSVTFAEVNIPDIPCTEITITRSFDSEINADDELEIFIDGKKNDLFFGTKDEIIREEEIFIRDYILPIEIAKFFFFDAEKIVSLAQINTLEQRRELSRAYSQVLGIQKYEDLRTELERIQDEYRKNSAQPKDNREFNNLITEIAYNEEQIEQLKNEIVELEEKRSVTKKEAEDLQTQLVREGDLMTAEELNRLKVEKELLSQNLKEAEDNLKELYNIIPFVLSGNIVSAILNQISRETVCRQNCNQIDNANDKIEKILDDIDVAKSAKNLIIEYRIRNFYEEQITELIKKYFCGNAINETVEHTEILHDFSDIQINDFNSLKIRIKECTMSFDKIFAEYQKIRLDQSRINKKIQDAEKKAESEYVQDLRKKKEIYDEEVRNIIENIKGKNMKIESLLEENTANRKKKEILGKQIEVRKQNKDVDDQATKLIHIIQHFLTRFKEEKKKALEKKIENKLKLFLHKTDLVKRVIVDINNSGDNIDITLYDARDIKIDNGNLSMGERQLFASALLSALVDETEIDFPVFIDSPMQKFDVSHTKNVLTQFYPYVSKQVVIFPLLNKELTEEEYGLILSRVDKAYLINNNNEGSSFMQVEPSQLFEQYNKSSYAN